MSSFFTLLPESMKEVSVPLSFLATAGADYNAQPSTRLLRHTDCIQTCCKCVKHVFDFFLISDYFMPVFLCEQGDCDPATCGDFTCFRCNMSLFIFPVRLFVMKTALYCKICIMFELGWSPVYLFCFMFSVTHTAVCASESFNGIPAWKCNSSVFWMSAWGLTRTVQTGRFCHWSLRKSFVCKTKLNHLQHTRAQVSMFKFWPFVKGEKK